MIQKDYVENISTQDNILQYFIQSEWKLTNLEDQSKTLNGIMDKNPMIKSNTITCSSV